MCPNLVTSADKGKVYLAWSQLITKGSQGRNAVGAKQSRDHGGSLLTNSPTSDLLGCFSYTRDCLSRGVVPPTVGWTPHVIHELRFPRAEGGNPSTEVLSSQVCQATHYNNLAKWHHPLRTKYSETWPYANILFLEHNMLWLAPICSWKSLNAKRI